jgi:hypothetical protein
MPIANLQRQMRTIGRIRTGNQVVSKGGRRIPNKLGTFRLTSPSSDIVAAAARVYGGEAVRWDNNGSPEWEVVTGTDVMDIVVPPGQIVSQWMELWSGGGCLRRCDGITNSIDGQPCGSTPTHVGDRTIPPCPLDVPARIAAAAQGAACKTTTRLNVILPELPDLGTWLLESHGYYAAVHLAGAADILSAASAKGILLPARLRLASSSKKVPGQPTRQWFEPVIEFETTFAELGITGPSAPRLAAGGPPVLPAIAPPASSDFRAPEPTIIEHSPVGASAAGTAAVAGTCGWRLAKRGGEIVPCSFAEMHPDEHSWHADALNGGGKVLRPE